MPLHGPTSVEQEVFAPVMVPRRVGARRNARRQRD